ncbi:hypothetical protein Tco_0068637 [Tanacetum coccineum]
MPPRMTTRSVGRATTAQRGGRTGGRAGRVGGRTRGQFGDQGDGEIDGQGGQVGGRGNEVNDGVDGVLGFSTVIAQQLQNLLPTGGVRNVIANNNRRGCTYKEFLACNPKEYDGKGGTDKSKITRKQSKTSKHGHENQRSTKRSQRIKVEARKAKPQSNHGQQQ